MTIDEENHKGFAASWSLSAKPCDSCKSASALLFCRADSAFLCITCDSKIHTANKLASRHERVWMCEVCEQAPASVTCKADAAALCVTCDRDIHSANPLARRHERFPVVPFYESAAAAMKANAVNVLLPDHLLKNEDEENHNEMNNCIVEEAEAASWLLSNPATKILETPDLNQYFFSDVDPYLDLEYGMPGKFSGHGTDSVVPVQQTEPHVVPPFITPEMDFCRSTKPSYSYTTTPSLSQSRKNRKFEKTIRYASRKAYAETRPRIKGRFAKRTELEVEVDRLYSSAASLMVDTSGYGIVPSF
ncbi:hypothetical protein IFM89_021552 [Coptis chinensis]|uniref:CONSTANS-like protein n=1 Tax=Coptis chinensis TaxID=261450 RepID=A0A835IFW1_9MAGN|nr:hypothetical protein IFM89_021552 [Coptis chinensis]